MRKFDTENYAFRLSLVSRVYARFRVYDRINQEFDDYSMQKWSVTTLILEKKGSTRDTLQLTKQVVRFQKSKLEENHSDTLRTMKLLTYIAERNSGNS